MHTVFLPGSDPKRPRMMGGRGISSPEGSCMSNANVITQHYQANEQTSLNGNTSFLSKHQWRAPNSNLLFANVHHLHLPAQPLDVLGCHFHHLLDLATLLRPCRHALDLHPVCKALKRTKQQTGATIMIAFLLLLSNAR